MAKYKESERVELKETLSQMDEALKSVCAFLNHKGGTIYFGVSDKGKVIGMQISDKTLRKVSQQINSRIKPEISPEIKEIKEEGKSILKVKILKGNNKPYFLNGIAYKKIGTEKRVMPPDELKRIIIEQKHTKWDEEVCEGATLGDIDKEKVRGFINEARKQRGLDIKEDTSIKEALMRLKLLKKAKPTNAALLLFGKNPDYFFMQSEVKCIRFKGNDVTGHMIDFKIIKGDIISQLKKIEDFIFEHIPMAAWIENRKLQRQEKWLYPPKAIREALANALAHRNYESQSKVQIRIFDDRIEFWNPGKLPQGWSVDTLKHRHDSIPKNPLIARIFFFIKYIEEIGTGTNKIVKWCVDWGLPEADFDSLGTSIIVIIRQNKLTDEYLNKLGLNEREIKAVQYLLKYKEITNKKYRELNPTISDRTALNDFNDLIARGIVSARGEKKLRYYVLR